ncbi:MAG: hypothetical protein ACK5MP_04505 [Nostocoides sp.]
MHEIGLALQGAWKVLIAGMVFGAGLPVLFVLAVRATTLGTETVDPDGTVRVKTSATGRLLSALIILILIGAVVLGITLIVAGGFGKVVDFSHGIPLIVDKRK